MKKLLVMLIATCLFAVNSNAQVNRNADPAQKVQKDAMHRKSSKMMKDLNLTPDQKAQMKEMHQGNKQQRDAIKNDASLSQDQKAAKMKELHKSQKEKMNSILTPDQKSKMKAYKMNHKKMKEEKMDKNS